MGTSNYFTYVSLHISLSCGSSQANLNMFISMKETTLVIPWSTLQIVKIILLVANAAKINLSKFDVFLRLVLAERVDGLKYNAAR